MFSNGFSLWDIKSKLFAEGLTMYQTCLTLRKYTFWIIKSNLCKESKKSMRILGHDLGLYSPTVLKKTKNILENGWWIRAQIDFVNVQTSIGLNSLQ